MYGKMLVLTFEDNEDDMMSHILSLINTREEIIQMSGLNNHLLNFKGLKIDEVQRVIILILSILVDTFISKISFPMQPGPEIGSISDA